MSDEETTDRSVPYTRFKTKVAELKEANAKLAELEGQIATLEKSANMGETWRIKFEELAQTFDSEKATWSTREAMLSTGIVDPEVQDLVGYRWGKLPEEDRPALLEWIKGDATKDPILGPILSPAEAAAEAPAEAAPAEAAPPTPKPGAPANVGARPAPAPAPQYTPEMVASMSVEDLKKNYGQISKAFGFSK